MSKKLEVVTPVEGRAIKSEGPILLSPGGSFTSPNNLQVAEDETTTTSVFNAAARQEETAQLTNKMDDLSLNNEIILKKIDLYGGAMSISLPESFEDIRYSLTYSLTHLLTLSLMNALYIVMFAKYPTTKRFSLIKLVKCR